jgi:hypothetical protein
MIDNLPWYKSKIIIGALISMIGKILVLSGVVSKFAPEDADALTNVILLLISGVGDLIAITSRVVQKTAPPISLRK